MKKNVAEIKTPTRSIERGTERELWARAAGRCEFSGCNRVLYKSPVTQQSVNIAQMAHIYSFSAGGPRGHAQVKKGLINDVGNLMLVCYDCHRKIDKDKKGEIYSGTLLKQWKDDHETRIRIVTEIVPTKKSHVIFFQSKIGTQRNPIPFNEAVVAMFPGWYPYDDRPIALAMLSEDDDSMPEFWQNESRNLQKIFVRLVQDRIESGDAKHISVFALAPQPLLIQLGTHLIDRVDAVVYQPHREPTTWKWQPHPDGFTFNVSEPSDKSGTPVLVFSLSAKIAPERIAAVLPGKLSVWEVSIAEPHNDFLRSPEQLRQFRETARKVVGAINAAHPSAVDIKVFPAMPVSCAVEFGRIRMPKADIPWTIFDQNNKVGRFISALTIGEKQQ